MQTKDLMARLRNGDIGETPLANLADGDENASLFRSWTRATLTALRARSEKCIESLTTGVEVAEVYSVPNTLGVEPANLLVVHRDGNLIDIAAAHHVALRPLDFEFPSNALLRALSIIPGSPLRKMKQNISAMRTALPMQQLVWSATSLALEAVWPERLAMRGFSGGGQADGSARFASYKATRAEWGALDSARRQRISLTLADITRRLSGLTRLDASIAEMVVGVQQAQPEIEANGRRVIHNLEVHRMPWLMSTTVAPTVWRRN